MVIPMAAFGKTPVSVHPGLDMKVYVNLSRADIQDIAPSGVPFGRKTDVSNEFSNKIVSRDQRFQDAIHTDYAVEWSGFIHVAVSGPQNLVVSLGENRRNMPKSAVRIRIDGKEIISLPWKYSTKTRLATAQIHLSQGLHPITVRMLVAKHSELKVVPLVMKLIRPDSADSSSLTPATLFFKK